MLAFFSLDMQWDPISFVGGCPCGCYLLLHFHWLEKIYWLSGISTAIQRDNICLSLIEMIMLQE